MTIAAKALRNPLFWALQAAHLAAAYAILYGYYGALSIIAAVSLAGAARFAAPFVFLALAQTAAIELALRPDVPFFALALGTSALIIAIFRAHAPTDLSDYTYKTLIWICMTPALCFAAIASLSPVLPGILTLGLSYIIGTFLIAPLLLATRPGLLDAAAGAAAFVAGIAASTLASFDLPLATLALTTMFCALFLALPRLSKPMLLSSLAGFGLALAISPADTSHAPALMAAILLAATTTLILAQRHQSQHATHTELEDRIARRTQRIRYLLHERDEVTTLAVHDLQSPIQAISGMQKTLLHMIDNGQTDATIMRPALEAAIATNSDLSDRIGSVLSANRDHLGGGNGPSTLAEIVREVAAAQTMPAKARALDLHCDIDPAARVLNQEDIKDVLDVLLDNAIRFSPTGARIEITSQTHATHAHLQITDQGPGVPKTQIPTLFADPRTKSQVGARQGIGLYLAHRRIRKLGGTLSYHPGTQGGACFHITLPLAPATPHPIAYPSATDL